ncbi:hypothetical protein BD310DRAFT_905697 [Dichomitus squalens]|uniref:Uncharacterized protein n=1 Tax=Dichomitus squalens TaxID=114155 RepID=A0A4Q9PYA7_9APHY|nr:hypothetical protein BD310DRAFT_905697 [Dichomitus squalens]
MSQSELEFRSPFEAITRDPLTLIELRMRWFSGKIRAKPTWWKKVYDEEIVTKWCKEIIEHDAAMVERFWSGDEYWKTGRGEKQWPRDKITNVQLNYLFDELRYDASRYDDETGIFATAIHKVHESRCLIPADVKISLVQGVSSLEDVPDEEKDWHPGSKKQVLDLVHPSMYCLRIGRSHVYRHDQSQGAPIVPLTLGDYLSHRLDFQRFFYNSKKPFCISHDYQWLPTDFEVSESGEVEPLAYINNLHPIDHRALYSTISSILSRFVPLFEKVLSDAVSPWPPLAVRPNPYSWYDHITVPAPAYREYGDNQGAYKDSYAEWESKYRWPSIPEPEPFVPPTATSADEEDKMKISLRGRTLQVIVKLANVVLTPDNPKYAGGSWHVEGMANENIVATGLYYYACENITESRLDFRTAIGAEGQVTVLDYQQDDVQGYMAAFGLDRNSRLNQHLGHVVAEEDKCVAFPNIYQHHVDEFELADGTKPGYRKILCLFVVDPFVRILSTSDVPPQQEHWALDEVAKAPILGKLPQELYDAVLEYASAGLVSGKEAEEDRKKLMKERSRLVADHNERVFEVDFNMCEH